MGTHPPKSVSPEEVERLRLENDELRATNRKLRKALERLAERQRELAKEQAQLRDSVRRLIGNGDGRAH